MIKCFVVKDDRGVVPVQVFWEEIGQILGYSKTLPASVRRFFAGAVWLRLLLASTVFVYGGKPFLTGS